MHQVWYILRQVQVLSDGGTICVKYGKFCVRCEFFQMEVPYASSMVHFASGRSGRVHFASGASSIRWRYHMHHVWYILRQVRVLSDGGTICVQYGTFCVR